ncbi:MAG: hypothetical protein P8I03_13145 [Thalassotalea sp.]|nr:hypothetical protein [Thalassotalea sp.]
MNTFEKLFYLNLGLAAVAVVITYALGSYGRQARHLLNIPLWLFMLFGVSMSAFPRVIGLYFVIHLFLWLLIVGMSWATKKDEDRNKNNMG